MPSQYRFLVHTTFKQQLQEFEAHNPEALKSLIKQCEKSRADPFHAGKLMRGLGRELRDRAYRLWIRGPAGFRYIYLADREKRVVLPVFVSLNPRRRFDYDQANWEGLAQAILQDLMLDHIEQFEEWTF